MKRLWLMGIMAFFVSGAAIAADFIEAQMKFRVLPDGRKDFRQEWVAEESLLRLTLGLKWDLWEPEVHARGFDLFQIAGSAPVFPDSFEGCSYYKGYGKIPGAADQENNQVVLEFRGPECQRMEEMFRQGTIAVHFYGVASVDPAFERTEVLRLQIWDIP